MRLRLEGEAAEIRQKAPELLKALADRLGVDLEKAALPRKEQELKYPALRALQKKTAKIYEDQMQQMGLEIQKVLSQNLKKGGATNEMDSTASAAVYRGVLHRQGEQLERRHGNVVHIDDNQHHRELSKADFTKPIADQDEEAYEKAKDIFRQLGYRDQDFEEGGVLYGLSVNQLRALLEELD